MIPGPFLVYLGSSRDELGVKTSRGVAVFRRAECVGEFRHDESPLTLGLPRMGFAEARAAGAQTVVLGIANAGGELSEALITDAIAAASAGLNVASGLHQRLRDEPRLVKAANEAGVQFFDVRDPPPHLSVGTGARRAGRRVLTVGTDCSVGKMYTTLALVEALRERGQKADFRATGQTGILIAGDGVPLDAVVADFIAGAIEQLSPARGDGGWDVIEGQGSLFHPSFAGVSTGLLHGAQPDALVICHEPGRPHMRGLPHYALPAIGPCIDANLVVARLTNPDVRAAGIALNTSSLSDEEAMDLCARTADEHDIPCTDPFRFGAGPVADHLVRLLA